MCKNRVIKYLVLFGIVGGIYAYLITCYNTKTADTETVKAVTEINVIDKSDIKYVIPVTRIDEEDVLSKAVEVGLIEDSFSVSDLKNKPITRAEYTKLYNKVFDIGKFKAVGCCMGNAPDLKGSEGKEYEKAVTMAATNGYLCTRNGLRAEDYLTVKELDTFTVKLMKTIEWSNEGTIKPFSIEKFREIFSSNKELKDLNGAEIESLSYGLEKCAIIRDVDDKLYLNTAATYMEVLIQAINLLDQRVIYSYSSNRSNVCFPCVQQSVDDWYNVLNEQNIVSPMVK